MKWKYRFGGNARVASNQALANVLGALNDLDRGSQSEGPKKRVFAGKRNGAKDGGKDADEKFKEINVDVNVLDAVVSRIQDTLHGQHDTTDERWPRKLQWPSLKYLRASWVYIWEHLQSDVPFFVPGEARIPAANAGHIACLGPCLMQAPVPVHTLIVHGELEYCTLLGHVLHVDLAVCFAAMRTLAHFLKGNTHLRELVFAFTGCPKVVTDESQYPVTECIASEVVPAFESLLEENETLRYVSFRVSHLRTPRANLRHMCSTSFEASCRRRTAMLCGAHPKAKGASPLARALPQGVTKRILDKAFPLPGPSRVDFEFCHLGSSSNRSRFAFLRFGRCQDLPPGMSPRFVRCPEGAGSLNSKLAQ